MTLRRRLLLAQAPLAVAVLVLGAASLGAATSFGRSSENILKDNYRSVIAAQRMADAVDGLDRRALRRASGLPEAPGPDLEARFEAELRVQEANITEPSEGQATARLRRAWEDYRRLQGSLAAARPPASPFLETLLPASERVRSATAEILDLNQDAILRKSNQARRSADRYLRIMLAVTLGALFLGLLSSVSLTARMIRPLSGLSQAVRRFGEGDLESRARPRGADEIAALGREFDTMADRLEQYRRSSLGDLLQAQQAAQAAIDSLPDPVLMVGASGRILNLNRAAEALLRLPPGEGPGETLERLDPALRERIGEVIGPVLAGRGPHVPRGLEEAVRVDGPEGPRRLLPRATALRSDEGAITGATLVLQDVTRLLRFDELKNDLVATVAHEFRTPLTSLHMAIHLLAEEAAGPLAERQADLLAAARQDCERLQGIVDDILDLSRIQAGRVELHREPVDAGALVAQAAADARPEAERAGILLEVEGAADPVPVLADAERVRLVLANLLGNAIRHTPAGGRIALRASGGPEGARLEVRDTGSGIPRQYRERIFDRFFQVPGAKRGGVGLGLYLSREIARAHGGELGVESEPGQGSTFWLTLPATPPA
jgi:signal transduction histidine kinase/HAMP domain-containing protein